MKRFKKITIFKENGRLPVVHKNNPVSKYKDPS